MSVLWWQFLANCTTSTLVTGLGSLWFFLVSWLGISKNLSNAKTAIRVCRWTSFRTPENSARNQHWHFGNGFPGMGQQMDRCIATLQQMDSMWNEVRNGPLSYSWQRSDLEMLISSWDGPSLGKGFEFSHVLIRTLFEITTHSDICPAAPLVERMDEPRGCFNQWSRTSFEPSDRTLVTHLFAIWALHRERCHFVSKEVLKHQIAIFGSQVPANFMTR
jgi:hypothetical protein